MNRSYVRDFTLPDGFTWCRRPTLPMVAHASYQHGNASCGLARVDGRAVVVLIDWSPAPGVPLCTDCASFLYRAGRYHPQEDVRQASFSDALAGGSDRG